MSEHDDDIRVGDTVRFHDGDAWTSGIVVGRTDWDRLAIESDADGMTYTREPNSVRFV